MATHYGHTNIIAADWRILVDFYCAHFDCVPVPPERNLAGDIIARGTGVPGGLAGIATHAPSSAYAHAWYGQRTQSPSTEPAASEPMRCTQTSLSATTRRSEARRNSARS